MHPASTGGDSGSGGSFNRDYHSTKDDDDDNDENDHDDRDVKDGDISSSSSSNRNHFHFLSNLVSTTLVSFFTKFAEMMIKQTRKNEKKNHHHFCFVYAASMSAEICGWQSGWLDRWKVGNTIVLRKSDIESSLVCKS